MIIVRHWFAKAWMWCGHRFIILHRRLGIKDEAARLGMLVKLMLVAGWIMGVDPVDNRRNISEALGQAAKDLENER